MYNAQPKYSNYNLNQVKETIEGIFNYGTCPQFNQSRIKNGENLDDLLTDAFVTKTKLKQNELISLPNDPMEWRGYLENKLDERGQKAYGLILSWYEENKIILSSQDAHYKIDKGAIKPADEKVLNEKEHSISLKNIAYASFAVSAIAAFAFLLYSGMPVNNISKTEPVSTPTILITQTPIPTQTLIYPTTTPVPMTPGTTPLLIKGKFEGEYYIGFDSFDLPDSEYRIATLSLKLRGLDETKNKYVKFSIPPPGFITGSAWSAEDEAGLYRLWDIYALQCQEFGEECTIPIVFNYEGTRLTINVVNELGKQETIEFSSPALLKLFT